MTNQLIYYKHISFTLFLKNAQLFPPIFHALFAMEIEPLAICYAF